MIITRTPFRIGLLGGGLDYPVHFQQNGGKVLSATIDKYCYVSVRYLPPFFEHKFRIVHSLIENVQSIDEIFHPSARECLRYAGIKEGVEVHHDGDLPARTGLGTSSAFTVGLLHALYALQGRGINKTQLALDAIKVEREILKENVGSQDQVAVTIGGFNQIDFQKDGGFSITPVKKYLDLEQYLMLAFTNLTHISSQVVKTYNFNPDTLAALAQVVSKAEQSDSIIELGYFIEQSWELKKKLSPEVSSPFIDYMYQKAKQAGAIGGKLLGAGKGGFLLLVVEPSKQAQVKEALQGMLFVPFRFESMGSQIIFGGEK